MDEIWRDIECYEGKYQVSNQGRVKSINYRHTGQERVMRPGLDKYSYLYVTLCKDGKMKHYRVHRLVAQAFIPNPSNKPCIDHINAIRTDNRADNLRWVTHKENSDNPITREHINQKNSKKIFCENIIYDSIKQCAKYYNVNRSTMLAWLTGQNTMRADFQAKGLRYYIEEEK